MLRKHPQCCINVVNHSGWFRDALQKFASIPDGSEVLYKSWQPLRMLP